MPFARYGGKLTECPVSGQETPLRNALVPIAPTTERMAGPRATSRPNADFVAQLIATSIKAPQTCARRRATPDEAIATYRARDSSPSPPGRALSRSL
jgi:hypothetical protein